MMATHYYEVSDIDGPWADYGGILRHGLAQRRDGGVILKRTGPFVPHVTNPPFELIVDEVAMRVLQNIQSSEIGFKPVQVEKAVRILWKTWSSEGEPAFSPENGEPESYILDFPHDQALLNEMPKLYSIEMNRSSKFQGNTSQVLIEAELPEADIFGCKAIWVSDKVREALAPLCAGYIDFKKVHLI